VIMVGEMRDPETISLAVEASETGHLVLGTAPHARGPYQTIHRIVDAFPTEAQAQIRHTLAENLRAVVSRSWCGRRTAGAGGRWRRSTVLTSAVAQLIREAKTYQIPASWPPGGGGHADMDRPHDPSLGRHRSDEAFLKATDKGNS